jgi:hypothetical protein
MGLNIKNAETERLIRELAAELHVSLTAAITDAVQTRLTQLHSKADLAFDVDAVLAMWREMGDRMGKEYLSQDFDKMLYDEKGLPR